jgi:hypothetical protein
MAKTRKAQLAPREQVARSECGGKVGEGLRFLSFHRHSPWPKTTILVEPGHRNHARRYLSKVPSHSQDAENNVITGLPLVDLRWHATCRLRHSSLFLLNPAESSDRNENRVFSFPVRQDFNAGIVFSSSSGGR